MKKANLTTSFAISPLVIILSIVFFILSCNKNKDLPAATEESATSLDHNNNNSNQSGRFLQVNLTANNDQYGAPNIDPNLINGWGIAFSATGTPWVGSQGGHVSTIYNREGGTQLAPVHIPSPGGQEGGNPTGVVFNPNAADFIIPSGNATAATGARFIFVGVEGIVSGWNPSWGNHSYSKFNHVATSAYTGLTLASKDSSNYLYAADFRSGKIVVWDKNWNAVPMQFRDNHIPWGYSPFNIQVINNQLFVTYAKVGPDGRSQAGNGKGFVNIFSTSGHLIKRFAARDELNAPWGVAMAPASFFPKNMDDDDDHGHGHNDHYRGNGHHNNDPQPAILVGNFGNGKINIYSLSGKYKGQLKVKRRDLKIDGLWAITFPPVTSTIDPNRLYFAAGPKHETDGLFGYIIKDSTTHQSGGGHPDYD